GRGWAIGPTVTGAAASGVTAATGLVIAREIGAAAFGHFTVVLTIATILTVGMLMSLHYVMYQELPRAEAPDRPALVTTALLSALGLTAALTAAGLLAAAPLTALLGVDVRTLCFSLALAAAMTANQLTESFLRGLKRYVLTAVLKFAVAVVYLGGSSYCLLVLGIRDAEFYLVALIATNAVFAVAAVAGCEIVPRSWSPALARSLYRHGGYVTVLAVFTALVFGVDVIFLNHWAGPATSACTRCTTAFPSACSACCSPTGSAWCCCPRWPPWTSPPCCGASAGSPRRSPRPRCCCRSPAAPCSSSCSASSTRTNST
ncbi:lipopolysaccharide biosynthesis protein, partial [Planomonospora algeriensis]